MHPTTAGLEPGNMIVSLVRTTHGEAPDDLARFKHAVLHDFDSEVYELLHRRSGKIRNADIDRALREASARGHVDTTKVLVRAGARFSDRERCANWQITGRPVDCERCVEGTCDQTALQAAARAGYTEVVAILVEAGADIDDEPTANRGRTALQGAAGAGHAAVVDILVRAGAKIDAPPAECAGRTALQAAAEGGHAGIVATLINAGANVNASPTWDRGRTALQAAAGSGHVEIVSILLSASADVQALPAQFFGRTALQAAVEIGHTEIVSILLKAGANIEVGAGTGGRDAFQAAAESGHDKLVIELLPAGTDVDGLGKDGLQNTALQFAAGGGHDEIMAVLITAGANINAPAVGLGGRTALQAAAGGGHIRLVLSLIKANVDINAPPTWYDGRTALQAAAGSGHHNIVTILLDAGANVDEMPASHYGRTALQAAVESGHAEIVLILLKAGANIDAPAAEHFGRTAIQAAAGNGLGKMVAILLTAGVNVNGPPSDDGRTALQAAAENGHSGIVSILHSAGANIEAPPARKGGMTALQAAAENGHIKIMSFLLKAGANANAPAVRCLGSTALQAAAGSGHRDAVEILLRAGANVNAIPAEECGRTALQAAAENGQVEIVSILLKAGADVQAPEAGYRGKTALQAATDGEYTEIQLMLLPAATTAGATPIHTAAQLGYSQAVERLLDTGIDIDIRDTYGRTCLILGISYPAVVSVLLDRGAATDFRGLNGETALHYAIRGHYVESTILLLNHDANTESVDRNNRKPLDIALFEMEPSPMSIRLIKLLLNHGCNIGRREMSSWRTVLGTPIAGVMVISETIPSTPAIKSYPHPRQDENIPRRSEALRRPSIMIEHVRKTPRLPRLYGFKTPFIRRLCSAPGNELTFPVRDPVRLDPGCVRQDIAITGSVVEWQCLELDRDMKISSRSLPTVGELATTTTIGDQEILSCYVCFEFLAQGPGNHDQLSATNPDNAFRTEIHKSEISWTLQSDPIDLSSPNSGPLFRSVDFRSTLDIGWIPDNGVDFFTLFIIDLQNKWRVLFDAADSHLTLSREILLPKKGQRTASTDNLLSDAQQWSNFRVLLRLHLRKAWDLVHDFKTQPYLREEVNVQDGKKNDKRYTGDVVIDTLSEAIAQLGSEGEDSIRRLYERTKEMIELEYNLVSTNAPETAGGFGLRLKGIRKMKFGDRAEAGDDKTTPGRSEIPSGGSWRKWWKSKIERCPEDWEAGQAKDELIKPTPNRGQKSDSKEH